MKYMVRLSINYDIQIGIPVFNTCTSTVCRMRNGNLKKFINSRLDKKEVNFVNFENIANYNKKEIKIR